MCRCGCMGGFLYTEGGARECGRARPYGCASMRVRVCGRVTADIAYTHTHTPAHAHTSIHMHAHAQMSPTYQVDGGEVLDLLCDSEQRLVHLHALGVPVVPEPDHHHTVLLRQDGLVNLPAIVEMGEHERHGAGWVGTIRLIGCVCGLNWRNTECLSRLQEDPGQASLSPLLRLCRGGWRYQCYGGPRFLSVEWRGRPCDARSLEHTALFSHTDRTANRLRLLHPQPPLQYCPLSFPSALTISTSPSPRANASAYACTHAHTPLEAQRCDFSRKMTQFSGPQLI